MSLTPSNSCLHCPACHQSFQLPSPYHQQITYPCPKCKKPLQIISRISEGNPFSSTSDSPGTILNPSSRPGYQILKTLGEGGFGKVYQVDDPVLKRMVALKVLRQSKSLDMNRKKRFLREIIITSQLDHPNIMPVYDGGSLSEGTLYFTMRELRGSTLKELLEPGKKGKKKKKLNELLQIFLKVCEAVEYAHSRDIIHRDLKPSNIAVGNFGEVIVLDWGLAKYIGEEESRSHIEELEASDLKEDLSKEGSMIGTPAYMSPEQAGAAGGVITPRSDIYGLGAILYEILTETPPFEGSTQKILTSLLMDPPVPPRKKSPRSKIPPSLEAICLKALEKEPSHRYSSVAQMIEDLRAFLEDRPVSVYKPGMGEKGMKFLRRHALGLMVIVLLTFIAAIFNYVLSQAQIDGQKKEMELEKNKAKNRENLLHLEKEKNRLQVERLKAEEARLEAERKEHEERKKRIEFMARYHQAQTPYLIAKDHFSQDMRFFFIKQHVIPNLKKALEIHPEFIEARWELIKIYLYLDRLDLMMQEMSKLSFTIAQYSKEGKGKILSQVIMQAMFDPQAAARNKDVIENFDRYKPDFVPDIYWHSMKAMVYFALKLFDESLKVIEENTKKYNINTWDAGVLKAWVLISTKKYLEGNEVLEEIISKYPQIPFPYMMRNFVLQQLNRWEEVLQNSRKILSLDPTCYIVWNDLYKYFREESAKYPMDSDLRLAYSLTQVRYLSRILVLEESYNNPRGKLKSLTHEIQEILFPGNQEPLVLEQFIEKIHQRVQASSSEALQKEFALLGSFNVFNQNPAFWKKHYAKESRDFLIQYLKKYPKTVDSLPIQEALREYQK